MVRVVGCVLRRSNDCNGRISKFQEFVLRTLIRCVALLTCKSEHTNLYVPTYSGFRIRIRLI